MISTRDLSQLPDIPTLRRLCQSLAMVDAIVRPDKDRFYWFLAAEELAYMYNWSGKEYSIFFTDMGTLLTGSSHEAMMSLYQTEPHSTWPGVWNNLPAEFSHFLASRPIDPLVTTFCIWRRATDVAWQTGQIDFPVAPDPDGSAELLAILDGQPETYQKWSQDYYERPVSLQAVTHIYQHRPLSEQLVHLLNDEADWAAVEDEARTIGYGQP